MPPEVIVPNRIEELPLPFVVNHGRDLRFFLAFVKKPIHGHHPPEEEPVLFHGLNAVSGTGGQARAAVPVNRRNMVSVEMNQPQSRVEPGCFIARGRGLSKSIAVRAEGQKPKKYKGGSQALCFSHGRIPDTSRGYRKLKDNGCGGYRRRADKSRP